MKKRTQFDIGIDTFGQVQKGTDMTTVAGICTGCTRPIDPKYTECYACHTYGNESFAQVRQAKQAVALTSELLYDAAHNCIDCGNELPEDSTVMHICPQKSTPAPTFKQEQRKTRRSSKVRTLTDIEKGIDTFDSRPRVFAGF